MYGVLRLKPSQSLGPPSDSWAIQAIRDWSHSKTKEAGHIRFLGSAPLPINFSTVSQVMPVHRLIYVSVHSKPKEWKKRKGWDMY